MPSEAFLLSILVKALFEQRKEGTKGVQRKLQERLQFLYQDTLFNYNVYLINTILKVIYADNIQY